METPAEQTTGAVRGWRMGWYNGWSPEERRAVVPIQQHAVRIGAMPKPTTCSICAVTPEPGSSNPVWLHDENYADPLSACPICRCCHRTLHDRFDDPASWLALVARHADGSRWFEQLTLDPASLHRSYRFTYPDGPSPTD